MKQLESLGGTVACILMNAYLFLQQRFYHSAAFFAQSYMDLIQKPLMPASSLAVS